MPDGAREALISFAPAVRQGSPVLLSLWGYSGCGKTLSALKIARGLAGPRGRIAIIDTERQRAKLHAGQPDVGEFLHANLTPPFTPERYVEALLDLYAQKPDVGILDSASHEWDGEGGLLEIADAEKTARGAARQGLSKWNRPKARHKKFMRVLLRHPMHLIVCFRAKRKFVQKKRGQGGDDEEGQIEMVGAVPIQEFGFIYETTAQLYLPIPEDDDAGMRRGIPRIERAPDGLLPAFPANEQISIETGERIRAWVEAGERVDTKLAELIEAGREAANEGTASLQKWWGALKPAQQRTLETEKNNLKSVAAAIDEQQASERRAEAEASKPPASQTNWGAWEGAVMRDLESAADQGADMVNRLLNAQAQNLADAPRAVADRVRAFAEQCKRAARRK